jgi:hypothetical protein
VTHRQSTWTELLRRLKLFHRASLKKMKPFEILLHDFIPKLKRIFALLEELSMILLGRCWLEH